MNKLLYWLFLPVLALPLIISCNTEGALLHLREEDDQDGEKQAASNYSKSQEEDTAVHPEKVTVITGDSFGSLFDMARAMRAKKGTLDIAQKITDTQKRKGRSDGWIAVYLSHVMSGTSEEKAEELANLSEGEAGSEIYKVARSVMIIAGKSRGFAHKYATAYESQLQAGKSQVYASNYAMMIARGKSDKYAATYADKKQKGKSTDWAHAYTSALFQSNDPVFAVKMADAYEGQIKLGKQKPWAKVYALRIAMGESAPIAIAHANEWDKKHEKSKSNTNHNNP